MYDDNDNNNHNNDEGHDEQSIPDMIIIIHVSYSPLHMIINNDNRMLDGFLMRVIPCRWRFIQICEASQSIPYCFVTLFLCFFSRKSILKMYIDVYRCI